MTFFSNIYSYLIKIIKCGILSRSDIVGICPVGFCPVGFCLAAMCNGINSTEPAGLILLSIIAYERANFKLLATKIT